MLREIFDEMLAMLSDVHSWRPMGAVAKDAMFKQLNRYGVEDQEFGDFCAKMLGANRFSPSNIVEHFQALYVQEARQKALPKAKVTPDLQSEEFVRFERMFRELRLALRKGDFYPTEKGEFHERWVRPLTQEDVDFAAQRMASKRPAILEVGQVLGGGSR